MTRLVGLVLASWLVAVSVAAAAPPSAEAVSATAHELEARLIAPCCWRETLDLHQSPTADELRREIRKRLATGESPAAIEASLVLRYGPKLRATLPGNLGYLLFGLFSIGGLTILAALGLRLSRRASAAVTTAAEPQPVAIADRERQRYEDKLDDDLAAH